MIKSSPKPSSNIIVAMMNYAVDIEDTMFGKYGFGYIELDEDLVAKIQEKRQKAQQIKGFIGHIPFENPITLLSRETIDESTHDNMPGFEYFKLDSMTYLEAEPVFSEIETIEVKGYVLCSKEYFTLNAELIPDGFNYSTIIYRTARFPYE